MTSDELRPCPFCGWEPGLFQADNDPEWWVVECMGSLCDVSAEVQVRGREAAIKAWNRQSEVERLTRERDVALAAVRIALEDASWTSGADEADMDRLVQQTLEEAAQPYCRDCGEQGHDNCGGIER